MMKYLLRGMRMSKLTEVLPIKCYDNGGLSIDRYTVVFLNQSEGGNLFSALAMNAYPFAPQGFGLHCSAALGRHLGKRIAFSDLPPDCQKAVRNDLGE